jgi:hypothetical protein
MIRHFFDWFTWFWGRLLHAGPSPSHDLAERLEHNRIACQKKLKEHQRRTLWATHVFASQRPAMVIVSDPGSQAVGQDYSFQEEEQTMHTAEGQDCVRLSEEDSKEDENNLFEAEDDLEGARVSAIMEDVIRHIDDPHSPGNRYTEMMRVWTFELLRTCGSKALDMVCDQFLVPSRQVFSQRHPSNYVRSGLTDFSLVVERVRTWCNNLGGKIGHRDCPRCIPACDTLACKSSVEVAAGGLKGTDVTDFDFDCDLFDFSPLAMDSLIS